VVFALGAHVSSLFKMGWGCVLTHLAILLLLLVLVLRLSLRGRVLSGEVDHGHALLRVDGPGPDRPLSILRVLLGGNN